MKTKLVISLLVLCLTFSIGFANAQKCAPMTFSNVSNNTFNCMKSQLQNHGINVPAENAGQLSDRGVTANFMWDGNSTLTIGVTNTPPLVSCEIASNELRDFVNVCQGS